MENKIKPLAILFDLDGTLVNSLADICGVINLVRGDLGLRPLTTDHLRQFIGKGVEHLMRGSIPERPVEQHPEMAEHFRRRYLQNPHVGGHLYSGVRETLTRLRGEGIKLGIATNKPTAAAEKTLQYYLPEFPFDVLAGPEKVSAKKPDPRHLLELLPGLGVTAQQVCFIGDDPVDLACAEAAGISFLAAGYGFGGVKTDPSRTLTAFPDLLGKLSL